MNQPNQLSGIRKLGTFITADALLVAILLVWAQHWVRGTVPWLRTYNSAPPVETMYTSGLENALYTFNQGVGIGLLWTYIAVLLALSALALAGWHSLKMQHDETTRWPIVIFVGAFTMAALEVFQACVTVSYKLVTGREIFMLLEWSSWSVVVILAVSILLVVCSMCLTWKQLETPKPRQEESD